MAKFRPEIARHSVLLSKVWSPFRALLRWTEAWKLFQLNGLNLGSVNFILGLTIYVDDAIFVRHGFAPSIFTAISRAAKRYWNPGFSGFYFPTVIEILSVSDCSSFILYKQIYTYIRGSKLYSICYSSYTPGCLLDIRYNIQVC